MSNDVDPVILLRMSERDWLTVVSDLNNEQVNDILEHETDDADNIDTQEQDTSFGDVENYERLIQTCDVNLDTLRNVKFSSDVTPKCLPQDHKGIADTNSKWNVHVNCIFFTIQTFTQFRISCFKLQCSLQIIHIFIDLIGTWEQLSEELREKLNQCLAFNRINKEIEIISLKIESITCKKETLDSFEEKEASMHKVNLQVNIYSIFWGIYLFYEIICVIDLLHVFRNYWIIWML